MARKPKFQKGAIDLRDIPVAVISIPNAQDRRAHIARHFAQIGLSYQFVDGVTQFGKKRNVAAAHDAAFAHMGNAPFLVCEDDVELAWDAPILPPLPAGADIIYLANSQNAPLADRADYHDLYHRRAYSGLALAEAHDATYLRLTSMLSTVSYLVVSERGRARFVREAQKSFNRNTAVDIRFSYAMRDLNVYGLRRPLFVESMAAQPPAKRNEERRLITHSPLPVAFEGERRVGESQLFILEVEARRDPNTRLLDWEVLSATPKPRARELGLGNEDDIAGGLS